MAPGLISRRLFMAVATAFALTACASRPAPTPKAAEAAPAMITLYLVRHAEKAEGDDPGLTPEGERRALALADLLAPEALTEIWSTNTRRTEQTAAPLAGRINLPIRTYDAGTLPAFATWLLDTPGRKLVVGHSNTTDALAALLGADPGEPFDEAAEFDRIYTITVDETGIVRSRIERYGAPE